MRTIIVDSNELSRDALLAMTKTLTYLSVECTFGDPQKAILYVKTKRVDLAIIDTRLFPINGIELGYRLKKIRPEIILIYISAVENYAMEALKLQAAAYLLKPVNKDELTRAIEMARLILRFNRKEIYVRTFGYFDVFVNGDPVMFKSPKAKELLALLIDRRGGTVTSDQIISTLWDTRPNDVSTQSLCSKVIKTLQKELDAYDIRDILIQKRGVHSVDISRIRCDMFELLDGNPNKKNCFFGDYMIEYSWAEERVGFLWKHVSLTNSPEKSEKK